MGVRRLVLVAVAMILVAACGSSGSSNKAAGSSGSPSSKSTATSGAPSGGGSSNGTSTTTVHFGGNGGSNFCDYARKVTAAFKQQPTGTDPAALKKRLQASADAIDHAASIAPSAIKADFDTFLSGLRPYLNALAAANYNITKIDPAKLQVLRDPKFTTASGHITQYMAQVCKVSPTGTP